MKLARIILFVSFATAQQTGTDISKMMFQFGWFENSTIDIGNATSFLLMFNLLN